MPKQSGRILEKMSLKIMEKLQKRVKACKNQTCFFYDYTNVLLMTDFVPGTPGLGGGVCSCILWYKDMPVAYLLITCNAGLDEEVLRKLNELPEVVEANRVSFGPYDIIVKVEADTIERFNQTVGFDIKRIHNITSAVTLIKNIEEPAYVLVAFLFLIDLFFICPCELFRYDIILLNAKP